MRNEKKVYPEWKLGILNKYLPQFTCETVSEKSFNLFVTYIKRYREQYGHSNIKISDVIDGYNIGIKFYNIKDTYNKNKLSEEKIKKLNELGIKFESKIDKHFVNTLKTVRDAVEDKVIISSTHPSYKGKNLYRWICRSVKKRYQNDELTCEQVNIIEKLIDKALYDLFGEKLVYTKVVDIIEDREIGIFTSRNCAAKYIKKNYGFNLNNGTINLRLTGKVTSPYKGRFMFYYATDEEIKRFLEDNKAS